MVIIIGIVLYILMGVLFLAFIKMDDEIKTSVDPLTIIFCWPLIISFILVGGICVAFLELADRLSGGK